MGTGIISGGLLGLATIDNTKYKIDAGTGFITDINGKTKIINWNA